MVKLILDVKSINNLKKAENLFLPIFINLPTAGTFIDKLRVNYPVIIKFSNIIFIMCLIDNNPYWLIWTNSLEQWFLESKFRVLIYNCSPCIKFIPLFFNNIPL